MLMSRIILKGCNKQKEVILTISLLSALSIGRMGRFARRRPMALTGPGRLWTRIKNADVADHEVINETYPTGGFSLPNRFAETTYLTAGAINLTGLRGITNGLILYKNATVDGDVKPLLAYFAFNDWTPIRLSGGRLTMRWASPGLFLLN